MRAWTLGVSVVFHLGVISAIVVAPLFATGALPAPRRAAPEYVLVTAPMPPDPPPLPRPDARAPLSPSTAPLTPPSEILPETPVSPAAAESSSDFGVPIGERGGNGFVPNGVVSGGDPLPPPPAPQRKEPVPVGGNIRAPQKILDVAPRYPALALASHSEGVVILQAVIGEDGSVEHVRVLRSKPLLDEAAMEAVRQWRFTPTLLNGQPVPVVMTVTVSFNLK